MAAIFSPMPIFGPHPSFFFEQSENMSIPTKLWSKAQSYRQEVSARWSLLKDRFSQRGRDIELENFTSEELLETIMSRDYYLYRALIREHLSTCQKNEVKELLKLATTQTIEEGDPKPLRRFFSLWALPQDDDNQTPLKDAVEEVYAQTHGRPIKTISDHIKKCVKVILDPLLAMIIPFLDTIVHALNLSGDGSPPSSTWTAAMTLSAYCGLLALPIALFTALAFVVHPGVAFAVMAGLTIAVLLSLVIYAKWLRPCPTPPDQVEVLTRQKMPSVIGRDDEVEAVINRLKSNNRHFTKHALLIGPSTVGKTEIIRELARRIQIKDVPSSLKNKKIFLVNTTALNTYTKNAQTNLDMFFAKFKKFDKEIIWVFDDLHQGLISEELGPQLKKWLDPKMNGLKNVIALTTTEGYESKKKEFIELFNRFEKLDVKSMAEEDTFDVLRQYADSQQFFCEDSMLEEILKGSNPVAHANIDDEHNQNNEVIQPGAAIEAFAKYMEENTEESEQLRDGLKGELFYQKRKLASLAASLHLKSKGKWDFTRKEEKLFRFLDELLIPTLTEQLQASE